MFLDEVTITVRGGSGGNGCTSWRREKYVPMGGPDGGDGGNGGSIYLIADANTDTLSSFASRKRYEAEAGHSGMGNNRAGKRGEDLLLKVPPGTLVYSFSSGEISMPGEPQLIADLTQVGQVVQVACGGRGGYGNAHFKSSVRQRPDFAERGEPGAFATLRLELKLVADVGIIGLPNAGKSTLISVISSAKPKIADYAFTTLVPNLGVVSVYDRSYVVCDVPGLIEGASEGKGLGDAFLRHIQRCGILLHVLDLSRALQPDGSADPAVVLSDYRTIRHELCAYSPTLEGKEERVIINKIELISPAAVKKLTTALRSKGLIVHYTISAATSFGTDDLKRELLPLVLKYRAAREQAEVPSEVPPVLRPDLDERGQMGAYRIARLSNGDIVVTGRRLVQFTRMTNFSSEGALNRFHDVIERIGLKRAITRERAGGSGSVYIGDVRIDEYL